MNPVVALLHQLARRPAPAKARRWMCCSCKKRWTYVQAMGGYCPSCSGITVRYVP